MFSTISVTSFIVVVVIFGLDRRFNYSRMQYLLAKSFRSIQEGCKLKRN